MDPESDEDHYNITIQALSLKTKNIISALLNPIKIIPTEKGLPRDWQGLAELTGIGGEQIPLLQSDSDPTYRILKIWNQNDPAGSLIKNLFSFLEELDRHDVIADTKESIEEDIKQYTNKIICTDEAQNLNLQSDKDVLTVDDLFRINEGLEPQNYDAFVLFAEDDIDFATELIDTMEKQYHLKLCVKDRDIVGGSVELEVIIKLISHRCNRLIVIVSPAFLSSPWNKFFVSFAQGLGIEQSQRKIIPCLYSPCKVPPELSCYFMLDYQRSGKLWDFWVKLHDSIRTPERVPKVRQCFNRSVSHQVHPARENQLKPALHVEDNPLKPKKEGVKFTSLNNLNETENGNLSADSGLNASSSSNSLTGSSTETKKPKSKGWFKKLLPAKNSKSSNDVREKDKKKFWARHIKRKIAVAN